MTFSEKLKGAMQQLGINQTKVVSLTGKSKGSISQYLNNKQTPSADVQRDIAVSLGLDPEYFIKDEPVRVAKALDHSGAMEKMLPEEAAKLLGVHHSTVRKGLQQGVFPWGYGIQTSENRWTYVINAKRFAEIEGICL